MTGKKLQVFYDMDNTIVEMSKYLTGTYSGRQKSYIPDNEEERKAIVKKLHSKNLFNQFHPIYGIKPVLNKLTQKGYIINIISQPMINNYCIPEKNQTIQRYFPMIKLENVIYTFNKYLIANKNRVLIDDNIEHLNKWEEYGGISVCFIRGYNKNWKGLTIKRHIDILPLLDILEG